MGKINDNYGKYEVAIEAAMEDYRWGLDPTRREMFKERLLDLLATAQSLEYELECVKVPEEGPAVPEKHRPSRSVENTKEWLDWRYKLIRGRNDGR